MNQIYADNRKKVSFEDVVSGQVIIYDNEYYIRTQENDEDENIICVRFRDGYVAHFIPSGKCEIFTGTLRMECD